MSPRTIHTLITLLLFSLFAGSLVPATPLVQAAIPDPRAPVTLPPSEAGPRIAVQIAAGKDHTCAVANDGSSWCWGRNYKGKLGNDSTTDSATPVNSLNNVTAIAVGGDYTCAVANDGSAWCWGYNGSGQLGDGSTTDRSSPARVSGLSNVTAIAAGYDHTCAVAGDGSAWCWGYNSSGQLGDGSTTSSLTPVRVSGLSNVTAISTGNRHTCAVAGDGSAWCWGSGPSKDVSRSAPIHIRRTGSVRIACNCPDVPSIPRRAETD